ncbi:MAG: hypothetical protein KDA81_20470, partial [Planctomycetaceae bacterium]|nr:hypothetical protein [Planctomycetaceae bacterium]
MRLDLPDAPPIWSGIYKIEGNTLTIAWAPSDGSAPRPNDFSGSVGTVQTWKRVEKLPTFATPQELVDYVSKMNAGNSEDSSKAMEQMFALVTEDEINRFAGLMLRTTSMMQMAAGLGAAFGNSEGADGNAEGQQVADFLQTVGRLNLIVDKYRSQDPSPEALAAYQQIAGGLNLSMLFQGGQPSPSQSVDDYSRKLRLAAGVLSDPRSFVTELTHELQNLEAIQADSGTNVVNAQQKAKPDWQVTVNGDTAVATDGSIDPDSSSSTTATSLPARMELIKVGDTWKISSLIPDRVIMEMQHGPTVSNSSSDSSGPPSPSMAPVTTFSGINAAVASTDLVPFVQLNGSNTTTSTVYTEEQTAVAIGTKSTNGKYLNRRLKKGEQITAEMLIDKPSTEQIIKFWLEEAENRRIVFQHVYQCFTREPEFVNSIPYDARHSAKAFNDDLPEWTNDYLAALTERLTAKSIEKWTGEEVDLLWSISDVIFFQRTSDTRNLKVIGDILKRYVSVDNAELAKISAIDVRRRAHSMLILGEAVRLNGSLPISVLELQPTERFIDTKLKLLKQMVENGADQTWISQEQIRLAGLLNEAPVQALKLLLTSALIENRSDLKHWIFAMSTDATYQAWRSSPEEDYSPPVDPVVVIAVAELLAGRDEVTDSNLVRLFEIDHPGYMFSRHVTDILAGDLAWRESVLKLMVSIYSKSKNVDLKSNLAKLAPAVPVLANQAEAEHRTQSRTSRMPNGLEVAMKLPSGPHQVKQEFKLKVVIANATASPIQRIEVSLQVPRGPISVRGATPTAILKADMVQFKPIDLQPGESRELVVQLRGEIVTAECVVVTNVTCEGQFEPLGISIPVAIFPAPEAGPEPSVPRSEKPKEQPGSEQLTQNTVDVNRVSPKDAAAKMTAPATPDNSLETWLRNIRSIGPDAAAKRDAALVQVEAALKSDDVAQNVAATQALAQTGDVKYEKAKYRERILELCRSSNRDLVKSALYALH